MSDIDQKVLDLLAETTLSNEQFAQKIQKLLDDAVDEATNELEVDLLEKNAVIRNLTNDLKVCTASRELANATLARQASSARGNAIYLLSITKNPVLRFLARFAKWPTVGDDYERTQHEILSETLAEMHRQDTRWGTRRQMPNGTGIGFLNTEMADLAKRTTDRAAGDGKITWQHILNEEVLEAFAESNPKRLKEELIQVAAVAIQWVVALTMQKPKKRR